MRHSYYAALLVVLVLFVAISFFFPTAIDLSGFGATDTQTVQLSSVCLTGERMTCSTQGYEGYKICESGSFSECVIAGPDDCSVGEGQLHAACCKLRDGSIDDCTNRQRFSPGEYIMVKTNLRKAVEESGLRLSAYKACGFSKLPDMPGAVSEDVACSPVLTAEEFNEGFASGFIPDAAGSVNLVEWRIYPAALELSNSADAVNNLRSSTSVFSFEVNVGA